MGGNYGSMERGLIEPAITSWRAAKPLGVQLGVARLRREGEMGMEDV